MPAVQRVMLWVVRRLAGQVDGDVWRDLVTAGGGYRSVLSWRLGRASQGVAVVFNLGLLAGFFGCLWVLKVGFYWESTLALSGLGLIEFMQGMAWPWAWTGVAPAPAREDIEYALLAPRFFYEAAGSGVMWRFLMMSLAVYGLLPRVVLWGLCLAAERRALARIDFQAPRHRELWRRLTNVERSLRSDGPADGALVLDVGGIEAPTEHLREFLLRVLRVNPVARYAAALMDAEREEEALAAIREAELGVVILVEGWALSPKEMKALHDRVRAVGGPQMPVHFLVMEERKGGSPAAPPEEEWKQWKSFVDSLEDPATDAVAFRELPASA